MAVAIEMPKLSLTMSEGTVLHWMKKVGEPVKKGEAIVEVSSDKEVSELEAPEDGVLLVVIASEGDSVACHAVIAYIGQPGEKVAGNGQNANEQANSTTSNEQVAVSNKATVRAPKRGVKISPVARRIAQDAGIDYETIVGTGPNGRITKEDVEKGIAESKQVAVAPSEQTAVTEVKQADNVSPALEKIPVTGMRKVIAQRMHQSLQQSAQLTHHMKADITELLTLKNSTKTFIEKRYNGKLTVTDFIARAVVLALEEHKQVNGALINDEIHVFSHIHLGIAVDVENGLVVPVVQQAQNKSLAELSQTIRELANQAKVKQLNGDDMKGSTFTISNLGSYGIEYFTPILNTPETAILGVGAAQATPVFVGEEVQKRMLLPLSLTFDHRVLDGAPAAEFLMTVKRYLEEPINLLL
ncbi:dihydrolipoamide acetyltransferase family protein [Bacillus sp. B15-48]|uniref:dihydrolipoamide acetyltransferase family protein n=1 Tax=Bacillus sp. B15-48 TaxID=1548601 RepID=UPI00193FB72A|nr:dihydrolipoamide acetyltransferase family protein [Bacillus sp. B15-48]MBM4763355.1 2-oxo acid dehydrogenase subunit E2 [Bacillus sp. B15-48]